MGREHRPPLKDLAERPQEIVVVAAAAMEKMEEEQIGVFGAAALYWKAERPRTLLGREKQNLAMVL